MSTRIELLKQAGFSDAEIGDWATAERQHMREAGFSDDEIDAEFGVTRPPKDVPPAFIERLRRGSTFQRIARTAADYAERYFGDEPLGFSPANQDFLHSLGAAGDILIPAAKPVDAVLRAVPAGIAAVGAGVGQAVEEAQDAAFGPGPEAKGKAARDFAQLAQIAALISGGNARSRAAPGSAPIRAPAPGIVHEPAIELPHAEDFRNAAAAISGTPASFQTEQKLLRLWAEHGISPTEVAADAMRDRTIAEDLRSASEKLPDAYAASRAPAAARGEPNAPAPPAEPAEAHGTTASTEDRPGAIGTEESAAVDPSAALPATTTAQSKAIGMFAPPRIPQRPFKFDYRRTPRTDDTGRLLEDMEGRPLAAKLVAGRRFAGKGDVPVSPAEIRAVLQDLDIRLAELPKLPMPNDNTIGVFDADEARGKPFGDMYIKSTLSAEDQNLTLAHEFGHAIDHYAGLFSDHLTPAEIGELRKAYPILQAGPRKKPIPQPEDYGYQPEDVNAELVAEGFRAYLMNPNWFKAVAPRAAARFRAEVNKNKHLKRIIQFNSLGAAGLAGAGAAGGRDQDDR
jgi:hypothetical protein